MHDRFHNRFGAVVRFLAAGVLLFAVATVSRAEPLLLEQAVAEVLVTNPELAAMQAKAQALAELPDQVEALPDPRLSINLANLPLDSLSFTQEGMTQFQLGISQVLPYPGKLSLRSQIARQQAGAAEEDVAEQRLQRVRDAKTVWWNLFYLDRALETIARNQTLLEQLIDIAETRYEVGQGRQQDVLLAQLELARLRDNAIRLQRLRQRQSIDLNLLRDRPSSQIIQLPSQVEETLPTLVSEALLIQRAKALRPLLSAQQQRAEAARSHRDLAKKDYFPDFMLGAVYGLRSGNDLDGSERADFGSILFSMNLPLNGGGKQDRVVDQRNAEWMQQKHQLHQQRNQVEAEIGQALSDYRYAAAQVALFHQEIIPQARQTVDVMLAGYQVGKADFQNLLRSQTTLYDYETEYWKALSVANQALASLVAAVGEENIYE